MLYRPTYLSNRPGWLNQSINQDSLRWAKKEFISAWKGWKPPTSPALPSALEQSALPSSVDYELAEQMQALTQKLSLNHRISKKSPPAIG